MTQPTPPSELAALEACPICGWHALAKNAGGENHYVHCASETCLTRGPVRGTKEQAIAAWNTRAALRPSAPVAGEVERADEQLERETAAYRRGYTEGCEDSGQSVDTTSLGDGISQFMSDTRAALSNPQPTAASAGAVDEGLVELLTVLDDPAFSHEFVGRLLHDKLSEIRAALSAHQGARETALEEAARVVERFPVRSDWLISDYLNGSASKIRALAQQPAAATVQAKSKMPRWLADQDFSAATPSARGPGKGADHG